MQANVSIPAASARQDAVRNTFDSARALAMRWAYAYGALYLAPFPLNLLLMPEAFTTWCEDRWHAFVIWIANQVLRLGVTITAFPAGSGDTTYNYVELLVLAVLAAAAAGVWTAVDPRTVRNARVEALMRVALRYWLGLFMVDYGLAKLFKSQFGYPLQADLLEPLGSFSPMHLLWTFMGYSLPYNLFTGAAEVAGGVLLFWRRTTTLGALVVIGVMANVVMLNFSYDVCVKLFSTHLLVAAAVLAAADGKALIDLLVLRRPAVPSVAMPLVLSKWQARGRLVLKYGLLLWAVGRATYAEISYRYEALEKAAVPAELVGRFEVASFSRDGVDVPPALTEGRRWRDVVVESWGRMSVRRVDDSFDRFGVHVQASEHTLSLQNRYEEGAKAKWTFETPSTDEVVMTGKMPEGDLRLVLHRRPSAPSYLMSRGFHWVNERPHQR